MYDWQLIEEIVAYSGLPECSQKRVLDRLDIILGEYLIEGAYPRDPGDLNEAESSVYIDIIRALNEGQTFGNIVNVKQYDMVIGKILRLISGPIPEDIKRHLIQMDIAYQNRDWNKVNAHLRAVEKLL